MVLKIQIKNRIKILRNCIYGILVIILFYAAANQNDALKVTYLGNCGFLYENNSVKVLIDPFGTEYGGFFYLPSEATRKNIDKGNAPFNNIDLLLITHIHGDHFNAKLTESFLLNNNKTKMICPGQVYKQMTDSCSSFSRIKSRIICPDLLMNESENIKINNISVMAMHMQHGTDRSLEGLCYSDYTEYEKTENYGYVIYFKNKNVFHQGDACLKINNEILRNIYCHLDVAHLSYFDWDTVSWDILKNKLEADNVIFMHGTKPAKELQSDQFKKVIPQIILFKQELESKVFN